MLLVWRLCRRWSRLALRSSLWLSGRPCRLGVDQPLEFATVEEDPAALHALVHRDVAALVGTHRAVALWTGQVGHLSSSFRRQLGRPKPMQRMLEPIFSSSPQQGLEASWVCSRSSGAE